MTSWFFSLNRFVSSSLNLVDTEAMNSNLKRNKNMTYDQKWNFFGTPRGEITGSIGKLKKSVKRLS